VLRRLAELRAGIYLRLNFYHIFARNLRLPGGEIDLIAKRGNPLICANEI
tara:strand:+ start:1514 stop:1663 length:150 start_codon:yes stop_codon:yes gene_type:complete